MAQRLKVKDSPRLYVDFQNASSKLRESLHGHSPYLRDIANRVLLDADYLVNTKPIAEGEAESYQKGTRALDRALSCLTTAWCLTNDIKYRKAALRYLESINDWIHISCEANSDSPPDKQFFFCLTYGEHACTIGLMYDLFQSSSEDGGKMTDEEKNIFFGVIDRFYFKEARKCLSKLPWWVNKEWSNWNGVCSGGMGILALAVYDDYPTDDTPIKLIAFVEESLKHYLNSFVTNDGGNHEGTGYWNYGMNYAMRYLLSWERATGKNHPAFDNIPQLAKSLYFPLDFTGISFGDNDNWNPTCFYFMLSKRLKQPQAAFAATVYLIKKNQDEEQKRKKTKEEQGRCDRFGKIEGGEILYAANCIPTAEEMKKQKERHHQKEEKGSVPVSRVYDGLGWAVLSDDVVFPRVRLAARGGSSKISGHGMVDLLSFRCRINGELMITDQPCKGYLPTTFTKRGNELYERSPASKSTLFVDGLGCSTNVKCGATEVVTKVMNTNNASENDGYHSGESSDTVVLSGIRIDASHTYLIRWKNIFIGRLFLMVESSYWIIVDRLFSPNGASDKHWLESRFHTLADVVDEGEDWILLKSGAEHLSLSFATLKNSGRGIIQKSYGMPSTPNTPQTKIFRYMSADASHEEMLVTVMNPSDEHLNVVIEKKKKENNNSIYEITVSSSASQHNEDDETLSVFRTIYLNDDLTLI